MFRNFVSHERRRFHRIVYDAPASLSNPERSWPVRLIDLSLHGCLVQSPRDWTGKPGMEFMLSVKLSDLLEIRMNLAVVRSTQEQIAFRCTHIDLDSICELRRLIDLNLGDSSLLERDLNSLTVV